MRRYLERLKVRRLCAAGLQKLFYKFLKKMNLNNVALTKIEDNPKKFKKVNFDANGNPTEENCP